MLSNAKKISPKKDSPRAVRRLIPPHILIFFFLQLLYFIPLWLVSSSSYDKGGVLAVGVDAHVVIGEIAMVYLVGFTAFLLGSLSAPRLCWLLGARWTSNTSVVQVRLCRFDFALLALLLAAFLISKLLLVREGVYSNYAFDTGNMDSSIWTASMFLSEALVLASIIMLFSDSPNNIRSFLLLSSVNGINLLHGTRNFFVVAVLAMALYIYVRTNTPLMKVALCGAAAFLGSASLAYAVFVSRSHVIDAGFSLLDILSPITFESLFSQMSLVTLLNHPVLISPFGSPLRLIQDITLFSVPRIFLANKGTALWIGQFGYLSPMGAFNGFAAGILYFGYLFPLFYYFAGLIAGILYRESKTQYGAIVYLYFTCDFLYRIVRDGYIIPLKMLINIVEILLLLALARSLFKSFAGASSVIPLPVSRK